MSNREQHDTILVGDMVEMVSLYGHLKRPERVLGVFCEDAEPLGVGCARLGEVADVPNYLRANEGVRRVYCCMSQVDVEYVRAIQNVCKVRAVKFCAVLPTVNELDAEFVRMHVGKQLLLTPKAEPLTNLVNALIKRLFDFVLSLVLLLTLFPVVYLLKYINAKRLHLGVALRAQQVTGPNGRQFSRLTFRTLHGGESRGWDNLPQLMNVFAGKMSLVGPDPIPVNQDADSAYSHLERRYLKSGMVSKARLKGRLGEESLSDDVWYAEHWSLWLDIRLLTKAILG